MRRMTTTLLVTMMLMSVFATLLPNELNENTEAADAGRGSGADPMLHDVTEPRESYTDAISGIVRNAMDVGDTTQFKAVIKNDGDTMLYDLSISIEVRLKDNSFLAPEIDTNDYVICDPIAGCPHENLSAGTWLANGSYTIRNSQGNAIEWTPTAAGTYTVKIQLESAEDAILTNNEVSYDVVVKDWTDISVDICWLDSQGGQCTTDDRVTGSDSNHFRVTARTDGSQDWSARGVTVSIAFSGSYDASTSSIDDGTGAQVPVSSLTNAQQLSTLGQSGSTEIWRNITAGPDSPSDFVDPNGDPTYSNPCAAKENPCNATRDLMTFETDYSLDGVVTPDTGAASGLAAYTVSASIVSHVEYSLADIDLGMGGQQGENATTQSVQIMYEKSASGDDRSYNDHDSIDGTFGVYHDIVMMGVTVGEDNKASGSIGVGLQWIHASVRHDGSDQTNLYDWNMKFTIIGDDGMDVTMWQDECMDENNQMQHMLIGAGAGAIEEASACVQFAFQPGDYSIRAEATFNNSQWSELTTGNNVDFGDFDAVNSPPSVTLMMAEIANPPAIVGGNLTFEAQASDIESTMLEDLTYTWSRQSAEGPDSFFCPEGPGMSSCHIDETNPSWIGSRTLTVRVCDMHGACASDSILVSVWNEIIQSNTTTDWTIDYSLVYGGMVWQSVWFSQYEDSAGGTSWESQELTGLSGSYNSVIAFDIGPGYAPDGENMSTYQSFAPESVARESLGVTFTGDVANDYSIWYKGATGWTQLSGTTKSAAEGGKVTLSWSQSGDLPNRLDTNFAVFEAAEATGNPPATGVVCDGPVSLGPAGEMVVKWTYEDATLLQPTEDRIHVTGVGNTTQNLAVTENSTKLIGIDGNSYNITIALHNSNGANPVVCTRAGVVADASVDPHPTVSGMTVTMSANDVSLNWSATTGDVAKWKICWAAFEFDSIDSLSCSETTDATTSATLAKSTVCGQTCSGVYYFAAAPVDDVGNDGSAASQAYLDLSETVDVPAPTNTGEDAEAGGGFPRLAIYMIAGVVITAVIVGAVIVTRGGGGEGDDFDY